MRYPEGRENEGRKTISGLRNENILQQYLGEYKTWRVSIPKIGTRDKQKEDEWQAPDKFQKISQMVFCNGVCSRVS